MTDGAPVVYEWRGAVEELELDWLHAEAFDHPPVPAEWQRQLEHHSLGWVCARAEDELVGFVKVLWDGGSHAFILDTAVLPHSQRQGVGTGLVHLAAEQARQVGATWLHVDFERAFAGFYLERLGFSPTEGGLLNLREGVADEQVKPDERLAAEDFLGDESPDEGMAGERLPEEGLSDEGMGYHDGEG